MNADKLADALRAFPEDPNPFTYRRAYAKAKAVLAAHDAQPAQADKTLIVNMGQAAAWRAVADALTEVSPGWLRGDGTGMECAVAAIKRLAQPAQAAQPSADAEDAARYRWLTNHCFDESLFNESEDKCEVDSLIDAARAAEGRS